MVEQEARTRFIELRAEGKNLGDIADELGKNPLTLRNWEKELADDITARQIGKTLEARAIQEDTNIHFLVEPVVKLERGERCHRLLQEDRALDLGSGLLSLHEGVLTVKIRYLSKLRNLLGPLGYFLSACFWRTENVTIAQQDIYKLIIHQRKHGLPATYQLHFRSGKDLLGRDLGTVVLFTACDPKGEMSIYSPGPEGGENAHAVFDRYLIRPLLLKALPVEVIEYTNETEPS